jgi:hypothetical protein
MGLWQAARIVKEELGEIMMVEVIAEAPMNSANPYFSTAWRQAFSVCMIETSSAFYLNHMNTQKVLL